VEYSRSRETSSRPATPETEPVVESRGSLPLVQQSAKSSKLVYRLLLQTVVEQPFIALGPFDSLQTLCGHTVFAHATCTNPVTSYILFTTFNPACEVFCITKSTSSFWWETKLYSYMCSITPAGRRRNFGVPRFAYHWTRLFREVSSSNVGRYTGYPDSFVVVFLIPSRQMYV
jgi:hypothetical protein